MEMNRIIKKSMLFAIIAALLMTGVSCDKDKPDERPDLPPWESIFIDFSDFADEPNQLKAIINSYDNFFHAFTNVAFWNTITSVSMALPSAAYYNILMMSSNPEYLGDNSWEWSKEFSFQQVDYIATLTSKRLNNDQFSMEMKIAAAVLPTQGVVWFDGIIRYDHTHAVWNLYKNDVAHVRIVEVEWNKDFETGVADMKYTCVEPGSAQNGSYIMFGTIPGADYDAYYTISLASGMINVEWDRDTKAGRIKDPAKWGDESWHCWNDLLQDIECP